MAPELTGEGIAGHPEPSAEDRGPSPGEGSSSPGGPLPRGASDAPGNSRTHGKSRGRGESDDRGASRAPGDAQLRGASRARRRRPPVLLPEPRSEAGRPAVRTADTLLAAYLAATGVLALLSGTPIGLRLGALHAVGVGFVVWLARRPLPRGGVARFFRTFLPVAVTPLFYGELATLNQLLVRGYLDATVQGWEAALFGGQPSLQAARVWPFLWLSELLHAGYLSYYLIVPLAALAACREGGTTGLGRLTVTVGLAFFLCYLCFAVFPVGGPRYEFVAVTGPPADGLLYGLAHRILEAGSSRGTAFPSSHVAASVAALLAVRGASRRWFRILAVPVALLTLGTVYGRFHYGVDALGGIAVGTLAYFATPVLVRWIGR